MAKIEIKTNQQIKGDRVLLVGDGNSPREMSRRDALKLAEEQELDLIMISAGKGVPVVRIGDCNKYMYEMKQKAKQNKKNSKSLDTKEIRVSPNIADNDLNTKMSTARKFLEKGHEVKITLVCRGREIGRIATIAPPLFNKVKEILAGIYTEKVGLKINGKYAFIVLCPKK